jgi:hypothetical protein
MTLCASASFEAIVPGSAVAEAAVNAKAIARAMTSAGAFRLVEREGGEELDRRPRERGRYVTSAAP